MASSLVRYLLLPALALVTADTAAAQYRRQVEELPPALGVSASIGALLSWEETTTPVATPDPIGADRRGRREVGAVPAVSVAVRYGRGIAVYGSGTIAFGAEAELSGTDPLTAAPLSGTEDVGRITIASVGVSFVPVRNLMGLRLDLGPAWLDMGSGGSYVGLRIATSARFLQIADRLGVLLAWDGYFAGGQDDREGIEYQIRGGIVSQARLGFELEF